MFSLRKLYLSLKFLLPGFDMFSTYIYPLKGKF